MNLTWLDDFLALASTGNFSRAADERHMTQPAFSRRIRALEEWLGAELFDRSSQPARLTETGEWFRSVAEDLLAQVARIPGEASAVAEASSSTLRFAATHALSFSFLPLWLRSLESRVSVGPISLVSDVLQHCEALMLQSKVQFVISHAHPAAPSQLQTEGFPSVKIGQDLLLPVSAVRADGQPLHALASSESSPLNLLSYSQESGIGRILREVHGAELDRLPSRMVFTAHLASVLRTMALDGRGIAWLPETLIRDDLTAKKLVKVGSSAWEVAVDVRLYRDRAAMSRAAESFWVAASAPAEEAGQPVQART